jgi:hypothetical protein
MQFLIGDCFWVTGARLDRYMCLVLVGPPALALLIVPLVPAGFFHQPLLVAAHSMLRSQLKVVMLADSSPNPD